MAELTENKFIITNGAVIGNQQAMKSAVFGEAEIVPTISSLSTSVIAGGVPSVNAGNPALLDISAGSGIIVDNTDPQAPIVTQVTWDAIIGQALPDVVNDLFTWVAFDNTGTLIFKQNAEFSRLEAAQNVIIGNAVHTGTIIDNASGNNLTATNTLQQLKDFALAVGAMNISGSVISANGSNLKLNRSAGMQFDFSANYDADPLDPHRISSPSETEIPMFYSYSDGAGGYVVSSTGTADIDVLQYDDGTGTLNTVPNNDWTVQALWFFPESNLHIVEYGQTLYSTLEDAISDIPPNQFLHNPILDNGSCRAWIAVKKGATDLSDTATNRIIPNGRFNP